MNPHLRGLTGAVLEPPDAPAWDPENESCYQFSGCYPGEDCAAHVGHSFCEVDGCHACVPTDTLIPVWVEGERYTTDDLECSARSAIYQRWCEDCMGIHLPGTPDFEQCRECGDWFHVDLEWLIPSGICLNCEAATAKYEDATHD